MAFIWRILDSYHVAFYTNNVHTTYFSTCSSDRTDCDILSLVFSSAIYFDRTASVRFQIHILLYIYIYLDAVGCAGGD